MSLKLHHVGVAVANIEEARGMYISLGYAERTGIIHDPTQTAFVQFLRLADADHYLELVAPDGPGSVLAAAASRRQPLNHLCFVTPDIVLAYQSLQAGGWISIREPTPAIAFEGRPIAWLVSPARLIIELVQKGPEGSL